MKKLGYASTITTLTVLNLIFVFSVGHRGLENENAVFYESRDTIRVKVNNIANTVLILEDSISQRTLEYFEEGEFTNVVRNKTTNTGIECRYDSDGVLYKKWNIRWPEDESEYDYFNEYYMGDIDFPGIIKLRYVYEGAFLMLKSDTSMVLNYKNGLIVK